MEEESRQEGLGEQRNERAERRGAKRKTEMSGEQSTVYISRTKQNSIYK